VLVTSVGSGSVVAGVTVVVPVQSYSKSHMVKVSTHNYMCTESTISDRCTANTSLVASHTSARRRLQYQCMESPGIQGVYQGSGFRHWYSNRTGFSS